MNDKQNKMQIEKLLFGYKCTVNFNVFFYVQIIDNNQHEKTENSTDRMIFKFVILICDKCICEYNMEITTLLSKQRHRETR